MTSDPQLKRIERDQLRLGLLYVGACAVGGSAMAASAAAGVGAVALSLWLWKHIAARVFAGGGAWMLSAQITLKPWLILGGLWVVMSRIELEPLALVGGTLVLPVVAVVEGARSVLRQGDDRGRGEDREAHQPGASWLDAPRGIVREP